MEEWKEIDGYTSYEVSNTGLVRDKKTKEHKAQVWNNNFWCTNLIADSGIKVLAKIHRLVALTFIGNPENAHNVIHINEDRSNNNSYNLKWKVKKIKELIQKEVKTLTFLGKTYTYEEFCEYAGCDLITLKNRLKYGWSEKECFTGIKDFKGQGYQDYFNWYPTREEFESAISQRRIEAQRIAKLERNRQKALERAEKKAKIHHGFGIFVNYPIKGIEGRRASRVYYVWQGIIARCYNLEHDSYERYGGRGCTVSEKWKHFQDFAIWYQEQQKRGIGNAHVNWHVDKDILVDGNLEYGPDTCCFVPDDVNIFFAGITDTVKGYTEYKSKWTSGVSTFGVKHQRCFDTEEDARTWYLKGKTQAAQFLIWKYEGLLEQRVVDKLSQI